MTLKSVLLFTGLICSCLSRSYAEENEPPSQVFNRSVKAYAKELRENDLPPTSKAEWEARRAKLKENLLASWGGFPETPCPLEPRKLGEIPRDGYLVEKVIFQTLPGVWMTSNFYRPFKSSTEPGNPIRHPAVLCVHGHWPGAKQDPVVQSRCIGLVKLGFVVLSVDAFGAGERGIGKQLGQYHGEMTGATLFPVGKPLSGIQVYENMRAMDYLITRSEVDPQRIGITGASGGGNQTMYTGAFDERFRCVVPTCSVGTFQAYLSAACCMCEVVPGILRYTEEGDVLGLAAHRGLMVTSATKDAFQFSVGEAQKSFARLEQIAKLYDNAAVKHTIIESPHHYNQPMREAMYGWMTRHLKGEGDGNPITEPDIKTEDPEALRCFPGESRPENYVTVPRLAATIGRDLVSRRVIPTSVDAWKQERASRLKGLHSVLGGFPNPGELRRISADGSDSKSQTIRFHSEPGVPLSLKRDLPSKAKKLVVFVNFELPHEEAHTADITKPWRSDGYSVATLQLRATEQYAVAGDKIGHAPDHNSAEWSLLVGRPLLGQWAWDVRRALDAITEQDGELPNEVVLVGINAAGPIALCAAAVDERISHVITHDALATYLTEEPYRGQRLGVMAPGILRDVGDMTHIAALIAPRKVSIVGGVDGGGKALETNSLTENFHFTRQIFSHLNVTNSFKVTAGNPR